MHSKLCLEIGGGRRNDGGYRNAFGPPDDYIPLCHCDEAYTDEFVTNTNPTQLPLKLLEKQLVNSTSLFVCTHANPHTTPLEPGYRLFQAVVEE